MNHQTSRITRLHTLGAMLGMALIYYVAGRLGLLLAIPPGYATAIWPSAGIALVGTLLFGYRVWPGIWLGSFLVNLGTSLDVTTPRLFIESIAPPACIALGAVLQALIGAFLVRRLIGFPNPLIKEQV